MNILVTGAKGFVGRNLVESLKNIRDGKDRTRKLSIESIYEYDIDSTEEQLEEYCESCGFVFNLAGVNRPKDPEEFRKGNFGFAQKLLETLEKHGNKCPVMLSSSIQATLIGRYAGSEYGKSKLDGEELFFSYGKQTGAKVLVYRFPNLFGKWCRPNYNSVVATFCNNIAKGLPIVVNDENRLLRLVFISNYITHHQLPFCTEMVNRYGDDFKFISSIPIEQEKLDLGYADENCKYPFIVRAYENDETIIISKGK